MDQRSLGRAGEPSSLCSRLDTYDGDRDALKIRTWLFSARETIFVPMRENVGTGVAGAELPARAVRTAATYLRGSALIWYMTQQRFTSWDTFATALEVAFMPPHASRAARDELANLSQSGSIVEYTNAFSRITMMIPGITQDEKMDRFVRGLRSQIRVEVLKASVSTVDQAMQVACAAESAYGAGALHHPVRAPRYDEGGAAPMELGAFNGGKRQPGRGPACWNCGKRGHLKADCRAAKREAGKGLLPSAQ
ncbi:hypothetical protein FVE85_5772 [Porphyridium purpureum]|uniref:CCHC-type domain-containing protein n=1 Tax=Porphyridium purpureum TaxID=35688 RepID=A0A5J4Z6B4_PORPP|nr:hypothetical protein FVE85_5772 [Porphyridium purpureum]|eukprot:POR4802..scf295_1